MDHDHSPVVAQSVNAGHGVGRSTLYVVATPIGNLSDITLRALEVLKAVDVVAAEDTRVTVRLLDRHGIAAKMLAVHEHNERRSAERIIGLLTEGKAVAIVSDAGTPGIADPGALLVEVVRAAGFTIVPVPGPNAAAALLSVSGFTATRHLFCGFLPARGAERRRVLAGLAAESATLVFYEAPHRVIDCVTDICAAFGGEREIVIGRELTKLHETVHRCPLDAAAAWLQTDEFHHRGEFVLAVEGAPEASAHDDAGVQATLEILLDELPLKQAVALTVKLTGSTRNVVYPMALALKGKA